MASFDDILNQLHNFAELSDTEAETPIIITSTRAFEVPTDYNTVIGHEGDVNSQIISFRIPLTHEGHSLADCSHKRLKWKNLSSGFEGTSTLVPTDLDQQNNGYIYEWDVPPQAFSQAGVLEISISFYDFVDGKIAFSWNTPPFRGLTIGESFTEVGEDIQTDEPNEAIYIPAADEILFVNEETRLIVAPAGYNNSIGNYGDRGTSFVYFRTKKRTKGIDLTSDASKIYINVKLQDTTTHYIINKKLDNIVPASASNGMISFVWEVPDEITHNAFGYIGNFEISLTFTDGNKKRWTTQPYTGLNIGSALNSDIIELDKVPTQNIIDGSEWNETDLSATIPGIIKIREMGIEDISNPEKIINNNELVVVKNGQEIYLFIGTEDGPVSIIDNYLDNHDFIFDPDGPNQS